MAEHELEFLATTAGDKAAEAKFNQLADDPNVYELSKRSRREGAVVTYKTRD
ncbi:hypothetical protein [Nocardia mangyaensis]|uniref:hypothetical protein n=1 Tax=Nocardia mangyaensis TaxID=2213200 RepID=UPI0026749608|nr:hypothetical protein [Nocardia mangyaensis]MDO3651165.1 hypothetical protein [Nocardia mangyaensis]